MLRFIRLNSRPLFPSFFFYYSSFGINICSMSPKKTQVSLHVYGTDVFPNLFIPFRLCPSSTCLFFIKHAFFHPFFFSGDPNGYHMTRLRVLVETSTDKNQKRIKSREVGSLWSRMGQHLRWPDDSWHLRPAKILLALAWTLAAVHCRKDPRWNRRTWSSEVIYYNCWWRLLSRGLFTGRRNSKVLGSFTNNGG